jgi:hypothetical protein
MGKQRYYKLEMTVGKRREIKEFLSSHTDSLPLAVKEILSAAIQGEEKFADSTAQLSLKLEMKIVPSSEKCNLGIAGAKPRRKRRNDAELQEHHRNMANYHKRQERAAKRRQIRKEAKRRIQEERAKRNGRPPQDEPAPPPEPDSDGSPDSDEDDSNLTDDDLGVESVEFIEEQTCAGANTDQKEYEESNFSIYASEGGDDDGEHEEVISLSDEEEKLLGPGPTSSSFDLRERVDFVIDCRWTKFLVETRTSGAAEKRITASTEELGPEGTQLTWQAVVNVIVAVFGFATPMRRLEKMVREKLSTATMVNISDDFARRYLPIYRYQAGALSCSDILSTDDTVTRVNEVTKWKRRMAEYEEQTKGLRPEQTKPSLPAKPWEERERLRKERWKKENAERFKKGLPPLPEPAPSLLEVLNEEFGFEFERKQPGKGTKISLHTTVVHGRVDDKDPRSRVVIYRTHFGSAGNLLDQILLSRDPDKKSIIIHGDMSAENNVSDPRTTNRFEIKYAGCLSHARRPFFRYRAQDRQLANIMLSGFAIISNVESMIDGETGRNSLNTILSRQNLAKPYWESILNTAKANLDVWSSLTPLGKGIRYIINNYENNTLYLSNPKLAPTNNDCENLLRWEALADATSFGCDTLEGRMRCDITRSALATCAFARVDARKYILFIVLASPDLIEEHPEHYTAQAFMRWTAIQIDDPPSDHPQRCAHAVAHKTLHIHSLRFQ